MNKTELRILGAKSIREAVPGQRAAALEDYSVDTEEGGVEDEAADRVALLSGSGGEVAEGSGTKGPAIEDDGGGGDLEDRGEVGEGGGDVHEAVVLRWVSYERGGPEDGKRGDFVEGLVKEN